MQTHREGRISGGQLMAGLGAILVVVVLVIAVIYARGSPSFRSDLEKECAKSLMQLVLIGIIGVLAKALIDDYMKAREAAQAALMKAREAAQATLERSRSEESAAHKSRVVALAALTENYWQIKKALHMIEAHKSAKTYGEQMRAIIDHRLSLQQLDNEIVAGMHALQESKRIGEQLHKLDQRLEGLVDEWTENYWRLARLQNEDEAERDPEKKRVPTEISRLKHLTAARTERFKAIHDPFERAANLMRDEIWPGRHPPEPSPVSNPQGV